MEIPLIEVPQREKVQQIGVVVAKVFDLGRLRTAGTALAKVGPQIEVARPALGMVGRT